MNISVKELSADSCPTDIQDYYACFKNIKYPRGSYQADSSKTETLYCQYGSPLNFRLHTPIISKSQVEHLELLFLFFRMKDLEAKK